MKSFKFIVIGFVLAIAGFSTLFVFEMAKTPKLTEQKHERERLISEAKAAKKKLEKLQRESKELTDVDSYVKTLVLADETAVLSAIKEISLLAEKDGLRDLELYYLNPDRPSMLPNSGGANFNPDTARNMGLTKAKAVFISMRFKSDFTALLNYLKDVYRLKTAFSVEQISIRRDTAIMPLQDIHLLLAVYMY